MEETTCYWYDPGCWLSWLQEELQQFALWIWQHILDATASALEAIPLPSWATGSGSLFGSIPGSVGYFLDVMEFGFGLSVIASAVSIRFVIRRIPLIG